MLTLYATAAQVVFVCWALCVDLMFAVGWWGLRRVPRSAPITSRPLPHITVLLAALHETESLERHVQCFRALAYPEARCELLLLTEEDDPTTGGLAAHLAAAHANVRHEVIPAAYLGLDHPHTKPRALSYGLSHLNEATELIGVLDAEDVIDPLLLAVVADGAAHVPVVQGRLAISSRRENLLSYSLGAEYALLEVLQRGRHALGWMKFPRGSTYFVRREVLEAVGWSTRNLTEDLALNVRLYAQGYETGLLDVVTWEEAPLRFGDWLRQRSRWCQGAVETMAERVDLSRLPWRRRWSVYHLFWAMVLLPLVALTAAPLALWDLAWALAPPLRASSEPLRVPAPVWLTSLLCLVVVCAQFVAASAVTYAGQRDRPCRCLAAAVTPLLLAVLLPLAAGRACWREARRRRQWEKTPHRGEALAPETRR